MQYLPFPMKKYRHPLSKGQTAACSHVLHNYPFLLGYHERKKTLENLDANCFSLTAVRVRTKIET